METAQAQAADRRARDARATAAYDTFLENVAGPVARQLANALKVEGLAFTLFTPAGGLRLASDRNRHDFIELALERGAADLQVVGHISHARGSRTVAETVPLEGRLRPRRADRRRRAVVSAAGAAPLAGTLNPQI